MSLLTTLLALLPLLATLLGVGLTRLWGWSLPAGIVLGLAISVASTVVLLRGLMDNSLLNTAHGQAAVGWLVFRRRIRGPYFALLTQAATLVFWLLLASWSTMFRSTRAKSSFWLCTPVLA